MKLNQEKKYNKIKLGIRLNLVKCVSIMLVVGERGEELLKSKFVQGWVKTPLGVLVAYPAFLL